MVLSSLEERALEVAWRAGPREHRWVSPQAREDIVGVPYRSGTVGVSRAPRPYTIHSARSALENHHELQNSAGARGSGVVFFFQAEDGIRDLTVTGVQTCALPIFARRVLAVVARVGFAIGRRTDIRVKEAGMKTLQYRRDAAHRGHVRRSQY